MGIKKISKERLLAELKKLFISKGFLKINNDPFCLEVILLIFPELKNINLFNNLNSFALNLIESKDFIFLISLMIIDDSDNVDYFIYKYNLSNNDKKRIIFLKNFFSKQIEKGQFTEKNLWHVFYLNNKEKPVFPVKAQNLIDQFNLKEGVQLGKKLKELENLWINNSFKISNKEIEKIVNN